MKRFALNKIKIAQLINSQNIKGKGIDTTGASLNISNCNANTCDPTNTRECISTSGGIMPCTNTSLDGQDGTNPHLTDGQTLP